MNTIDKIMALADAYATAVAQQGEAHDHVARDALKAAVSFSNSAPSVTWSPGASIYITPNGNREFDDWGHDLPVGRNSLYTAPQPRREPLTDELKALLSSVSGDCYLGKEKEEQLVGIVRKQYTAPQPAKRKPLTRDQALAIVQANPDTMTAIRMTEAAHGITGEKK